MGPKEESHLNIRLLFTPTLESILGGMSIGIGVFLLVLCFLFFNAYQQKIYPNIYIDNVAVSGLTKKDANQLLKERGPKVSNQPIYLSVDSITIASSSSSLGKQYQFDDAVEKAFQYAREGSFQNKINQLFGLLLKPHTISSSIAYDFQKVKKMATALANETDIQGEEPSALLETSGNADSITIQPGKLGRKLLIDETATTIAQAINTPTSSFSAQIASTSAVLNQQQIDNAKQRAQIFVDRKLTLTNEPENLTLRISDQDLVSFLSFPSGISDRKLRVFVETQAEKLNREPIDAVFEYNPETLEVFEFQPHRNGVAIDTEKTVDHIKAFIENVENNENASKKEIVETLTIKTTQPTVLLENTNDLGIKEKIGFGESEYDHSIPSRIHNVAITTEKISNTLIAPGEEFSFNKSLGEVSRRTGYKPAYVISGGRTILGDGGGVCQVSSTTFRALLDAGVEVTRRLPHSYRVSYYELNSDPGFDATVYSGNVDLRFINDTNNYILIYGQADSKNLYMTIELYGTSDGRTTEIVDYKKWGWRPPLPTQYIPDSSLAPGQLRQIDWSASGISASFKHIIRDRDGNIMSEKTYSSTYRPWAAKYLKGV